MNYFIGLLINYGYIVLFFTLMLELIAFPMPGGLLMTYCGYLVYQNKLNFVLSIIVAGLGASIGITFAYFLGKLLGNTFVERHGKYIHLGPERLEKVSGWFNRYGNKLIVVGFFIPGVRHITGYFSGIAKIKFKDFAFNAYIGAFLWATIFISLGRGVGPKWNKYHGLLAKYSIIISIIIGTIMIIIYVYKNHKYQVINFTLKLLRNGIKTFHSLGEIKLVILGIGITFLVLSGVLIGIIQDFFSNESSEFDDVTQFLVNQTFGTNFHSIMKIFKGLASIYMLSFTLIITLIWIIIKKTNRRLEIRFVLVSVLGAYAFEKVLRIIFHRLGPMGASINKNIKYTFPSPEAILAVVVFGFFTYLIVRHTKKIPILRLLIGVALTLCFLIGLSLVYFQIEYPTDVLAGYVLGGVWLSLNIILLEIYRVLPNIRNISN
jgi:membrane protein DedA with SNARE-associated domain/membrane-associated phospholipid phosphatase